MESDELLLKDGYLDLKLVPMDIFSKVKHLNDDIVQFGLNNTIDIKENRIYLNLDKFIVSYRHVISMYKEKLTVMDSIHDRNTYLDSEIQRINRLLQRNRQDYDTLAFENVKLKDTVKSLELNIESISTQLKNEKTTKRVTDSNNDREKTGLKNEKIKLEKELENLKDRMGKLLSNPKKQYSNIEFANEPSKPGQGIVDPMKRRKTFSIEKDPGMLDRILLTNMKLQLNDVLMENRELRDVLVNQLSDLEQITGISTSGKVNLQRNNSGTSVHSDDSDVSNQTFILDETATQKSSINPNNKLLLEMPFHLIKENVKERYLMSLNNLKDILKEEKDDILKNVIRRRSVTGEAAQSTNQESLQKEVLNLKKKLKDYEELMQGKEKVIELAIQEKAKTRNDSTIKMY